MRKDKPSITAYKVAMNVVTLVHYGINKAPVLATPFKGVAPLTERLSVFPITKKTGALFPPTSTRDKNENLMSELAIQIPPEVLDNFDLNN